VSGFQPYEGANEIVERLRAELAAAIEQRDDDKLESEPAKGGGS
jgi:hypothetical protein